MGASGPWAVTDMQEALLLEPPPDVARTGRGVYVSFGVNCASLLCILGCLSTSSMVINPDPPGWSVLMMLLFVAVDLPLLCLQLVVARSHSTVRTIVTRRGLVCMGLSTRRLPWPSSRSDLYPVVRGFSGRQAVIAFQVDDDARAHQLFGVIHIGRGEQVPQMLAAVNAQLDAVWAWGVERGCAVESGRYRALTSSGEERARRRAAARLEAFRGARRGPGPG